MYVMPNESSTRKRVLSTMDDQLLLADEATTKKRKVQMLSETVVIKKNVPKKRILMVNDVHLSDMRLQSLVKSTKCLIVPLVSALDNKSPVLIQLSGGGLIPLSFGIDDTEVEGRRKVNLNFQVDAQTDHDNLERLRNELKDVVVGKWSTWYPDTKAPSPEVLHNLCNALVSVRKKKTNSDDTWSGVSKAQIDVVDCSNGKCKIVDSDTGLDIPFDMLPGMRWHKMIVEFRYIYIMSTKSYGITRKLRYLSCSALEEDVDIAPL
jgi:hypothetical protein